MVSAFTTAIYSLVSFLFAVVVVFLYSPCSRAHSFVKVRGAHAPAPYGVGAGACITSLPPITLRNRWKVIFYV